MQISGTICRHIHEHMSGNSANSNYTACMLDRIIRIKQLYTYCSDLPALTHSKHFCQPAFCNNCHIIIQEQKILPICITCSIIVDRRIIKFFFPANDSNLRIFLQFFVICKNLLRSTVILYNDDLIILIFCFFFYGCNTRMKRFFLIFIWNDDRNKRFSMDRILYPENPRSGVCVTVPSVPVRFRCASIARLPASNAYILLAGLSAVDALCVRQ